jgi:deoxyribodipyrimidine photo-lyase
MVQMNTEPVNPKRIRLIKDNLPTHGPAVYWMSRDQRSQDNWALLFAQQQALQMKTPLIVVFCLVPDFLHATVRQYSFMLKGLRDVASSLAEKNISFHILVGKPEQVLPRFLNRHKAGCLVADFDPLRIKRQWKATISAPLMIPFYEVDSHNIVPCWHASEKQEYGAYTIRPKILRSLQEFLAPYPKLIKHPHTHAVPTDVFRLTDYLKRITGNRAVSEVDGFVPGEKAAHKLLKNFLKEGLRRYAAEHNDPNLGGNSGLSPYLHFGQLSAQRVALEVRESSAPKECRDAFLEELIIRRELSDNFCYYNASYDTVDGFPAWARKTLNDHRKDRRDYCYSGDQFERSETHDELWNAAQTEMVVRGHMHGYLRMYWAKKILEWTESPEQAMEIAIYLNDRYELDGRDPNGYAGIAWSIGGVHDRAWGERPIFGKIRYMSYNGCRSKFSVSKYIRKVGGDHHATNEIDN